jgi:hypothetical protein
VGVNKIIKTKEQDKQYIIIYACSTGIEEVIQIIKSKTK